MAASTNDKMLDAESGSLAEKYGDGIPQKLAVELELRIKEYAFAPDISRSCSMRTRKYWIGVSSAHEKTGSQSRAGDIHFNLRSL